MVSIEIIKYALKNLWLQKSRSFLTILSILVGIMTVFIFVSFGLGLYLYVEELSAESGLDKILVQPRGGMGAPGLDTAAKLTDDDVDVIEKTKGVKMAGGMYFDAAQVESDGVLKYVYAIGIKETNDDLRLLDSYMNLDVVEGRELRVSDSRKVLVGYNYIVDNTIFEKGLSAGEKLEINGVKFEIVGVYESLGNPSDDANLYLLESDYKSVFPDKEPTYGIITGVVFDYREIDTVIERVEKNLRKSRDVEEGKEDFSVESYQDLIEQFSTILNVLVGFIVLIALISVVVASVNTANTMVTSVLERTKEIGIMKAIGAENQTIRFIFLLESSTLGFVAGVLGALFGWIIAKGLGATLNALGWGFLSPATPIELLIACVLFSTLVGTFSGMLPAINASKQSPVNALRYE